jgi:hypothetical protein
MVSEDEKQMHVGHVLGVAGLLTLLIIAECVIIGLVAYFLIIGTDVLRLASLLLLGLFFIIAFIIYRMVTKEEKKEEEEYARERANLTLAWRSNLWKQIFGKFIAAKRYTSY